MLYLLCKSQIYRKERENNSNDNNNNNNNNNNKMLTNFQLN